MMVTGDGGVGEDTSTSAAEGRTTGDSRLVRYPGRGSEIRAAPGGRSSGADVAHDVFADLELARGSPQGSGDAVLRDARLAHSVTQVVAGPFRQHPTQREPGGGAHASREKPEAEAQTAAVEIVVGCPAERSFQLAHALELTPLVAEVVGHREPGSHRP